MAVARLTPREREILDLVTDGAGNDAIAQFLGISRRTVESHLRTLFKKLGVSRRGELGPRFAALNREALAAATIESERVPERSGLAERDLAAVPVGRLRELEEQLRSYETAILQLSDRQVSLFSERVEITMTIGETAGEDFVVERRWTTPRPYVIYRVTRPVLPSSPSSPLSIDDLDVSCEVVGMDVGVALRAVLDRTRRHQLLVTFQPGLETETEWVLRYRAPGMWNPLRETGEDTAVWRPGVSHRDDSSATSVTELTVRFVVPRHTMTMDVTERRGLGVTEDERLIDGRRVLIWRDLQPGGARYEWTLKQTREQ